MGGVNCVGGGMSGNAVLEACVTREVSSVLMPQADQGFDKDAFVTAFEAYMREQKENKRGRQAEKEQFFEKVKAMFREDPVDYAKVYQTFRQAYKDFSPRYPAFAGERTVGQSVVAAWTQEMRKTFPEVTHAVDQEESRKAHSGFFSFFFKPKNVMRDEYKPKEGVPFKQEDFMKAWGAYMENQYATNRGYYAEKKAFFEAAKEFFSNTENADDPAEAAYQAYKFLKEKGYHGYGAENVGGQVVAAWADKVLKDYPSVGVRYQQREREQTMEYWDRAVTMEMRTFQKVA